MQQVTEQNLENVWLKFFQSVAKDLRNTVNAHVKYTSISLCIYVYIYICPDIPTCYGEGAP